ncbi:MAG: UDP-glucose/GDP-mannose dehydrogenase family protein [Candidatus Omnitrophica bacterium]|nr:UDP-glucose/GDP-mannose dehydrogenase family protein [Candidatus Omnitrophota bacterium]
MNIAIIGSGYVGLVTGLCLADIGHKVICVDSDISKIKKLKKLELPIYEPGLEEILKRNVKKKRLSFSSSVTDAAKKSEVIFIAVGTPSKKNGDADLTYVEGAARDIAKGMDSYKLIVEKSTVPAHTGKKVQHAIRLTLDQKYKNKKNKSIDFDVASNPEFLREGSAVSDFMNPDRIVIGAETKKAKEMLSEVYKPLKARLIVTDVNSAELIKHASNSFLATKISFANAVSQICDKVGADVLKVVEGMGLDRRIGRDFLSAGVGYGGSCFPKDVDAFVRLSEKVGYDFALLKEVRQINESQKKSFSRLIEDHMWILKNKTIGVLGLAFKPNTDDMRSAPSLDIIRDLQKEGAKIKAYDPQAMEKSKKIFSNVKFCKDAYEVAKGSDCLVVLTEWDEFTKINFRKIRQLMSNPLIFDGRNMYNKEQIKKLGFEYYGIGTNTV